MYKIKKFDDELSDDVFVDVKNKTNDFLWWVVFDVLERPIMDIRLMRIKNQMEEKFF